MWCASPPHNPHPAPVAPLADPEVAEKAEWCWGTLALPERAC